MTHKTLTVRLPIEHVGAFEKFRSQVGYHSDNAAAVKLIVHALAGAADCITLPQPSGKVQQTDATAKLEERLALLENQVAQLQACAEAEKRAKPAVSTPSQVPLAQEQRQEPMYEATLKLETRPMTLTPMPAPPLTPAQRKSKEGIRSIMLSDLPSLKDADWVTLHEIEDELGISRTERPAKATATEVGL